MRESVYSYLTTIEPFDMFGIEHIAAIFCSLFFIITVPIFAQKNLDVKSQYQLGKIIGWIVFFNYITWVGLELFTGTFDQEIHLPIHLCQFTNLVIPLVMVWRSFLAYEILFFWGFSGLLQVIITPDIAAGFPHFHFFRFWIGHSGVILALVYATLVYEIRPTFKSLIKSFVGFNIFFVIALFVNLILDTNYFWICGKPVDRLGNRIPTLLDFMGPWPWYILTGELVALALFLLVYSPFYFSNKKRALK